MLSASHNTKACRKISQAGSFSSLRTSCPFRISPKSSEKISNVSFKVSIRTSYVVRSKDGDEVEKGPLSTCVDLVKEIMTSLSEESDDVRLEAFMECLPDAILDKAIASKKEAG
jgi:hypothetical protein